MTHDVRAAAVGVGARALRYAGLVLLAALILWADPAQLWDAVRAADPWWLLLAWVLNVPQLGIKAWRWHRLVRWQGIRWSWRRAALAYFAALPVGFLTPGRLGEAAKAVALAYETRTSPAAALTSVVVDRAFDMYLLLALGALGAVRFAVVGELLSWPQWLGSCVMLCLPLVLLHPAVVRRAGTMAAGTLRSRVAADRWRAHVEHFAAGLDTLTPGRLLACAALTAASYAVFFFQCFCCMWALGFHVPARDLVLLQAATNFLAFIPLAPAGLGTREAALVFFLGRVVPPQPASMAIAYGLIVFLVFFVGGGLLGSAAWLRAPIDLRRAWHDLRRRTANE